MRSISFKPIPRDHYEPTLLDSWTDNKPDWAQIACCGYHTAALTKNGKLYTWGHSQETFRQLEHGEGGGPREIPTKIESLDEFVITKISCGGSHMAALTGNGEIFTWYVPV